MKPSPRMSCPMRSTMPPTTMVLPEYFCSARISFSWNSRRSVMASTTIGASSAGVGRSDESAQLAASSTHDKYCSSRLMLLPPRYRGGHLPNAKRTDRAATRDEPTFRIFTGPSTESPEITMVRIAWQPRSHTWPRAPCREFVYSVKLLIILSLYFGCQSCFRPSPLLCAGSHTEPCRVPGDGRPHRRVEHQPAVRVAGHRCVRRPRRDFGMQRREVAGAPLEQRGRRAAVHDICRGQFMPLPGDGSRVGHPEYRLFSCLRVSGTGLARDLARDKKV